LREDHKLFVFGSKMLVAVYGSKKDKVGGELELCSLCTLTIITGLAY